MRGKEKFDKGPVQRSKATSKKSRAGAHENLEHPAPGIQTDQPSARSGSGSYPLVIIQERAYFLFESRGREHGHDLDHWLEAEEQIIRGQPTESKQAAAEDV